MGTIIDSLKLLFLDLNWAKAEKFAYLQVLNAPVTNIVVIPKDANRILTLPQRAWGRPYAQFE
jgi:hypothetical protein